MTRLFSVVVLFCVFFANPVGAENFTYDAMNRLIQASSTHYGVKNYVYDEIGNLLEKDGRSYSYGTRNLKDQDDAGPHAVVSTTDGVKRYDYAYDDNGNLITKIKNGNTTEFRYSIENRLTDVTRNGQLTTHYEYDGDAGRTKRVDYTQTANNTCFLAGTEILMADGSAKAIEQIQIGDRVLSYNETTGETVSSFVSQLFQTEATKEYFNINDRVRVTGNHPFYTNGEWKEIEGFSIGDTIFDVHLDAVTIKKQEKITLTESVPVYNIEVDTHHNYFAGGYLVHNKISFEQPQVTNNAHETSFVGSLFENNNGRDISHIFLGATRIASVNNGEALYFHQNHLGSTHVTTNKDGVKTELIEYLPYGALARYERYGSSSEVAHYYFTGKPFDQGSGLYFLGARYYDPELGRFIQADTIVQDPNNSVTFNRYHYSGNNPVNYIDPDGHGFWKSIWGGIKTAVRAFFNFQVPGLGDGLTGGSFNAFSNEAAGIAISALFSWGNPLAIAASFIAMRILDTPPGKKGVNWVSEQIFDDALGFTPKTAQLLGNMISQAVVSSAVYLVVTPETYSGVDLRDPKNQSDSFNKYGAGSDVKSNGGTTTNQIVETAGKYTDIKQGRIASQNGWPNTAIGKVTEALNINHTAVLVKTSDGFFDSALDSDLLNPFKSGDLWGSPWTGTCQQVCFTTLVEKGGMSGVQAFTAVGGSAGWSFYASSAIYGVRADFGGVGLVNGAINGNYDN